MNELKYQNATGIYLVAPKNENIFFLSNCQFLFFSNFTSSFDVKKTKFKDLNLIGEKLEELRNTHHFYIGKLKKELKELILKISKECKKTLYSDNTGFSNQMIENLEACINGKPIRVIGNE